MKIPIGDWETPHHLLREAQLAAALEQGEHIVPVYEVGEHAGIAYFTMMRVNGGPLETPAQNPRRAAETASKIARAVAFAHRHGILHRDLKPANVLVDRESGRPFVTDFGLAVREGSAATTAPRRAGTPEYMAPEAWDEEPASTLADIWSVGAILYELLSSHPPYEATSSAQLRHLVTTQPLPALPSGVPADLEAICRRCLQKEPARRYATAGELADDLERFLADEPVHARRLGIAQRLVRRARRHPLAATLAVLLLVVLAQAIATSLSRSRAQQAAIRAADFAAHSAADLTALQFERYSAEVQAAAGQPMVAAALAKSSASLATDACLHLLDAPSFPAGHISHWSIFDPAGVMLGRAPVTARDNRGRSYAFRDYFIGAQRLGEQHVRKAYVSRRYLSEADERYEISISFPVYAADEWLGLLVASLYSGPTLGTIALGGTNADDLTAAILAPRDVDRNLGRPQGDPPIFILHRALAEGTPFPSESTTCLAEEVSCASWKYGAPHCPCSFASLWRAGWSRRANLGTIAPTARRKLFPECGEATDARSVYNRPVFLILMVVGLTGLVVMAIPGFGRHGHLHGTHGHAVHGGGHAGARLLGSSHAGTHGAAQHGGVVRAARADTHLVTADPHAGRLRFVPSPRAVFTALALYGAFANVLVRAAHFTTVLAALVALIPTLLVERLVVRPIWNLLFRFQAEPTSPLEELILSDARALVPFRNGRGIVSTVRDGRMVQLAAELVPDQAAEPIKVGDALRIEGVDARRERVTVSVLRS